MFSAVGPLLGPAYVQLSEMFNVPLSTWNIGIQGGPIACIGFGSLIFNALAVKFGKRPIYLSTTVGLMVTCFWAASAKSLNSLMASRIFMGFCMAPLEALVPASIADVWSVDGRATFM
jgi:MFS family permease